MSKKYVIRNCPAFAKGIFCKGGDIIDDGCADKTLDRNTLISCQDCTDCVLKQIVSRLNNFAEDYGLDAGFYADELLSYLDIQEVE